jgi:hypothetical protein
MRVAQAEDVVGAWQMLALPPDVAQRVNVSPRFGEPYQWLLITADGRVGFVTTPEAPDPPITATSLRQMFDREPNFDAYTLAGGVMTVTTPGVVGFAAKRDVWHVDAVWTGGMLLGLAVRPGDLLMQLRDQTGRSIYQRVVRRIG